MQVIPSQIVTCLIKSRSNELYGIKSLGINTKVKGKKKKRVTCINLAKKEWILALAGVASNNNHNAVKQ